MRVVHSVNTHTHTHWTNTYIYLHYSILILLLYSYSYRVYWYFIMSHIWPDITVTASHTVCCWMTKCCAFLAFMTNTHLHTHIYNTKRSLKINSPAFFFSLLDSLFYYNNVCCMFAGGYEHSDEHHACWWASWQERCSLIWPVEAQRGHSACRSVRWHE